MVATDPTTPTQTQTQTLTGAEVIGRALAEEGVEYVFNLPGNGVYPMLDPLHRHGIQYVLGLHEGALVSVADGYARASGKVPFVNLYMVPGTANGLSGIYIAHRDKTPMVVTCTQQSRPIIARDSYASHNDVLGLVRGITKWSWEVNSPERLPEAIHRAFKIANTPPYGPVFLALPVDLFPAQVTGTLSEPSRPSAVPVFGAPREDVLDRIADLLLGAERVLVISGQDVLTCDAAGELVALVEEVGAAQANEPWNAMYTFPTRHPQGFGEYNRDVLEKIQPTLVFGVGARLFVEALNAPEPAFPEGVTTVNIGLDATDMGRMQPSDLSGVGDVKLGLQRLLERVRGKMDATRRAARLAAVERYQQERRDTAAGMLDEFRDLRPMSIARLTTEVNRVIDPETVIVEHATSSTGMLMNYLDVPNPRNIFGTGGSVQGWGGPASIGVQLGRPDQKVLAILGDGGFTFTVQGLYTAAHSNIPVTMLVLNNHGYRSMRGGMMRGAPNAAAAGVNFGFDFQVGIGDLARGFGVQADTVEDPAQLAEVLRDALNDPRPRVVEAVMQHELTFRPSRTTPMGV